MKMNNNTPTDQEIEILKIQRRVFIFLLILSLPILLLSQHIFYTIKYGFTLIVISAMFIGVSSIINRVSILKPKWQQDYPRGKQAVIIGSLFIISEIIAIIILLSPILPDGF
jgi:hypothetical protein